MTALPDLYRTASRASLVDLGRAARVLETPLLERAIGVIYRPQTERASHCFAARLDEQFDVVIHLDRTSALQPLDEHCGVRPARAPETYRPESDTAPGAERASGSGPATALAET